MRREGALKIVLALVGLLFLAGVYPIVDSLLHADQSMYTDDMMRGPEPFGASQPDRHCGMVELRAWGGDDSDGIPEGGRTRQLWAVAALVAIGVTLIALSPAKQPVERAPAVAAYCCASEHFGLRKAVNSRAWHRGPSAKIFKAEGLLHLLPRKPDSERISFAWTEGREDGIHVGFFVFARRLGVAFWRKIRRPTERKQVLDTRACREAILERGMSQCDCGSLRFC